MEEYFYNLEKAMSGRKGKCYGCEDGCDSCIPPMKKPGFFDCSVLETYNSKLQEMIETEIKNTKSKRVDEEDYTYSLGYPNNKSKQKIQMQRYPGMRDTTILSMYLLIGNRHREYLSFRITPQAYVIPLNEPAEYNGELILPIVRDWIKYVREHHKKTYFLKDSESVKNEVIMFN